MSPCFCQEAFGRASKINPRVNHHARVAAFPDLSGRDRCVVATNACKRVGTVNQSVLDALFSRSAFLWYNSAPMPKDPFATPRRSERVPLTKAVYLIAESEGESLEHPGQTVDVSDHGMRVLTRFPLRPGQAVRIIPADGSMQAVRCLVIWTGDIAADREGQAGLEYLTSSVAPG